jgi:hypothetical protein
MEHRPPFRLGLLFGLGMILMLILLDLGLASLILTSPVDLLSVLRALLVVLTLPVMGIVLFGVMGLRSASYRVDRNAISIRWGQVEQVIPLPDVEEVLPGTDLGRVTRFRGIRWPGCWVGRGRVEGVGAVQFYCTSPLHRHLVIRTAVGSYAISPQSPTKFVDLLATQRAMGVLEPGEHQLTQPQLGRLDRVGGALLLVGGVLNLFLYFLVGAQYGRLPHRLPLHFDPAGLPDRVGPSSQLFVMVGIGTAAWILDGALGVILYRRFGERMAGYLLWGAAAVLQILIWVAIAGLIGT